MEQYDAVVIGGGFYGLYLAEFLSARLPRIAVCERSGQLMSRASFANQARVHNGYHYPRSILTALRSRVNFRRFVNEFEPAINSNSGNLYAVARRFSKLSADQFVEGMRRIGAMIEPAPQPLAELFDPLYIERVFLTQEYTFHAGILLEIMERRVGLAGVDLRMHEEVLSVEPDRDGSVRVVVNNPAGRAAIVASQVFCCAYSQLNAPGAGGGLELSALKHEIAEIALVEVPLALRGLGVTVMDGPFFSLMPFPARGLHSLTHVRYTPHSHWYDDYKAYRSAYAMLDAIEKRSAFPHMIRDSRRYLPAIADCRYRGSIWEVKTILPRSEQSDARPILFRPHAGLRNYHLVMGGKIDNVYDLTDVIARMLPELNG